MGHFRLFVTSVLTMLSLLTLMAGSAFGEEKTKMLPESGVSFTMKGASSNIEEKGAPFFIPCQTHKGTGTITSANSGTYKVDFEDCGASIGSAKSCVGAGEAAGVILNEGEYHFWLAKETLGGVVKLIGVLAELPKELHYSCTVVGIAELFLVKGCVAMLAEPLNTLASVTKDVGQQTGGVQLITRVLSTETSESTCELLMSLNGAEFKQAGWERTDENESFKRGTEAVTVLLMNPEGVN